MTYTYPGVYIEELPSGQHTITGVATSIAAFIGWSNQGPVSEAVMVESWPEYQTLFGGMIPGIYLGYAVYQFFLNGGSQAYIVRLTWTDVLTASNTIAGLTLYANNPGTWRNNIFVLITQPTSSTTFNLQVIQTAGGQAQTLESYTNLSTAPTSPQYAVTVINSDSNYITFTSPSGSTPTSISLSTSLPVTSTVAGTVSSGFFVSYEQVISEHNECKRVRCWCSSSTRPYDNWAGYRDSRRFTYLGRTDKWRGIHPKRHAGYNDYACPSVSQRRRDNTIRNDTGERWNAVDSQQC